MWKCNFSPKMPATTTLDFESAPVLPQGLPTTELDRKDSKHAHPSDVMVTGAHEIDLDVIDPSTVPTEEEMLTLRKVAAPLP